MNNYSNFNNYYQPELQGIMPQPMPNVPNMSQKPMKPVAPNPNNNNNFNQCTYVQKNLQPGNLYDPYAGFIRGNMFPDLYDQYKITKPFEVEPMNDQAQLLTYVDALSFAAHDLNLYLDNHPEDQTMINLFDQYRVESEKAIKKYEGMYGPLFVSSDVNCQTPWAWNQLPWPWENR